MKIKLSIGFLLLFFFLKEVNAQQDSIVPNSVFFKIENLNFVKNNEYFNHIADGYTLLGSQLHPKVAFYPASNVKLELGVFSLKYSGLEGYHKILPTFSLNYKKNNSSLILGTLENRNKHGVIDPLLDFESMLDERSVENGLQYKYENKRILIDSWLNWEEFIFKKDDHNEEFVMGLNFEYIFLNKEKLKLTVPVQNLFYHRGGQINTNIIDDRTVFTMRHTALGLKLDKKINEKQNLKAESFFIQHQSNREPEEFRYEEGFAWYSRVNYYYKNFGIGVGHWYGDCFVSPRGDAMYQSVSTKTDVYYIDGVLQEVYAHHSDPIRSLLLGELTYGKEILSDLHLEFRTNIFFQNYYSNPTLNNPDTAIKNQLDYAVGLYVRYNGDFKIH